MEIERAPFDLQECVEAALDLLAPKAAEKDIDILYQIDGDVPRAILGDLTRTRQILINLAGNAIKFTSHGEVLVTVSCEPRTDDLEIHISVRDTGIGIPPDRMDRLFQSFSQVDASTTRRFGGTGLGLAISKRLTELLGGTIWAESQLGVGSVFHFTIRATPAPGAPRLYLRADQPQLTGRRILVVDDNATNRRIVTHLLEGWGMTSRTAASAHEALGAIHGGERFDLGILDCVMPDLDGPDLAEEIRKTVPAETLPLLLLASARPRDPRAAATFAAVLTKPVKPSRLYDALVDALGESVTRAARAPDTAGSLDSGFGERTPLRILVAEDNSVNQKVIARMLQRFGYEADLVVNGVDALEAMRSTPYDVVFMDVQMPELDGLEATRRARASTSYGNAFIIPLTANATGEDRAICLDAGMDAYMSKPVRLENLREMLVAAGEAVAGRGLRAPTAE